MNPDAVRKNMMAVVGALGATLVVSGLMLGHDPMLVTGLINLIACALWFYGQTLFRG